VRDSAAILDAIQGADAGAPYVIKPPEVPYSEEINRDPGSLKIAFHTESPLEREHTIIANRRFLKRSNYWRNSVTRFRGETGSGRH